MSFVTSVAAQVIAALVVAALLAANDYLRKRPIKWRRVGSVSAIVLGLILLSDLTPMPIGQTLRVALFGPASLNEKLTTAAWEAFNRGEDQLAIRTAQQVLAQFEGAAQDLQRRLAGTNEPLPPVGRSGPREAEAMFARGVLNDVAVCAWLQGQAYERLDRRDDAVGAYRKAAQLTYARAWDGQGWPLRGWSPTGWFWSPAESARDRLRQLGVNSATPESASGTSTPLPPVVLPRGWALPRANTPASSPVSPAGQSGSPLLIDVYVSKKEKPRFFLLNNQEKGAIRNVRVTVFPEPLAGNILLPELSFWKDFDDIAKGDLIAISPNDLSNDQGRHSQLSDGVIHVMGVAGEKRKGMIVRFGSSCASAQTASSFVYQDEFGGSRELMRCSAAR